MRLRHTPIRISENQGLLPFRPKQAGLLSYAHPVERLLFMGLGGLFLVLSVTYIYFLSSSVGYVSARGDLTQHIRLLGGQTAQLEAAYLARSVDMTESYATTQGLVHVTKPAFVERATSLSLEH